MSLTLLGAGLSGVGVGGGGGGGTHRYWAIEITAKTGVEAGLIHCEFGLLGAAPHTPVGATASSEFDAARNAAKAIDGNAGSEWAASTTSVPQHLILDFGSPVDVNVVRIIHRLSGDYPTDINIRHSDDGSTLSAAVWSVSSIDLTGYDNTRIENRYSFPDPTASAFPPLWRINVTTTENGAQLSLTEIEFRDSLGGTDLSSPSGPFWHKQFGFGLPATGAFDDNTGTIFHTASGQDGILGCEIDGTQAVLQIAILPRASNPGQGPGDFKAQSSADGVTWTDEQTFTGTTGWTAGVTKTFNI